MSPVRCVTLGFSCLAVCTLAKAQDRIFLDGFDPGIPFRISDMALRDPHVFLDSLGCRDVTDVPLAGFSVNGQLQTEIQTDGGVLRRRPRE